MPDKSTWRQIIAAVAAVVAVLLAFVIAALGAPFWLVFIPLLAAWLLVAAAMDGSSGG